MPEIEDQQDGYVVRHVPELRPASGDDQMKTAASWREQTIYLTYCSESAEKGLTKNITACVPA